jgi:hypothetical protein
VQIDYWLVAGDERRSRLIFDERESAPITFREEGGSDVAPEDQA